MQRPAGVTIIAILGFIVAGLAAIWGLGLLVGGTLMSSIAHRPAGMMLGMSGVFAGVVLLGVAALLIVTCIGLLKLQEWARILTIVLNAVHLVIAALGLLDAFRNIHIPFFVGVMLRHIVMLAVGVWIIVYLMQPKARQAFGAKASTAV
jgi:hypothetical protein